MLAEQISFANTSKTVAAPSSPQRFASAANMGCSKSEAWSTMTGTCFCFPASVIRSFKVGDRACPTITAARLRERIARNAAAALFAGITAYPAFTKIVFRMPKRV